MVYLRDQTHIDIGGPFMVEFREYNELEDDEEDFKARIREHLFTEEERDIRETEVGLSNRNFNETRHYWEI